MGGGVSQTGPPPCIAGLLKNAPGENSGGTFPNNRIKRKAMLMAETPKAPELTKPVDFIVPNQDLYEKVIDQRLAAHAEQESSTKTSTRKS